MRLRIEFVGTWNGPANVAAALCRPARRTEGGGAWPGHGGLRARAEGGGAWPTTAAYALGGGRRRLASHGGLRAGRLAGPPPGVPAPGLEGRDGRQEA